MVSAARVMTSVDAGQVQAERHPPPVTCRGEAGDDRVIGVHDQHAVRWQGSGHDLERVGDRVDFAVAVELVAEEVRDEDGPRPDLGCHQWQGTLVDLGDHHDRLHVPAQVGGGHRKRRDALDQVGARLVVRNRQAGGPQDGRGEPRGRRFPVAAGDRHHGDALVGHEGAKDAGVQPSSNHARQRGPAPATHRPRANRGRFPGHERGESADGQWRCRAGSGEAERRRRHPRSGRRRRS